MVKKIEEDRAADTVVAVFRVDDLSHPQRQYKVSVNAGQMALTGTAVITHDISVVIVEGGTRWSNTRTQQRGRKHGWLGPGKMWSGPGKTRIGHCGP